jgi:hypothetical protein
MERVDIIKGDVLHFFHLPALHLSYTISPCLVTPGWMRQERFTM